MELHLVLEHLCWWAHLLWTQIIYVVNYDIEVPLFFRNTKNGKFVSLVTSRRQPMAQQANTFVEHFYAAQLETQFQAKCNKTDKKGKNPQEKNG